MVVEPVGLAGMRIAAEATLMDEGSKPGPL